MTYRETESHQHTVALFGIANVSDPGFLRIAEPWGITTFSDLQCFEVFPFSHRGT